jgi:polyribonucleotide nucleotidyltransferase
MIGAVIGPGGKIIQDIQNTTGATVAIEEIDNMGVVDIAAVDKASIEAAVNRIKAIVQVPEIGTVYNGKVKSVVNFGAFIEIYPGKEGLLHISEISWKRINNVEDEIKVGDEIEVKLLDVDQKSGNLKLSRRALLPKPPQEEMEKREPRENRDNRDSRGNRDNRDNRNNRDRRR